MEKKSNNCIIILCVGPLIKIFSNTTKNEEKKSFFLSHFFLQVVRVDSIFGVDNLA